MQLTTCDFNKESPTKVFFSVDFAKFFWEAFLHKTCERLLTNLITTNKFKVSKDWRILFSCDLIGLTVVNTSAKFAQKNSLHGFLIQKKKKKTPWLLFSSEFWSSHRMCSVKKSACNFIKKRLQQVFSFEICKIFKNTYFEEHLQTTASEHFVKYLEVNFSWATAFEI